MLPVVSIIGHSNSGKTTLLERLIRELKLRGYRVAAIKHTHRDFEVDQPGKDSWRLRQAGCDTVVLSSPTQVVLLEQREEDAPLDGLLCRIDQEVDLVLTEGFKQDKAPRIEVHRRDRGPLISLPEALLAIVTEDDLDTEVPRFSPEDIGELADLIETRVLASSQHEQLRVEVNGRVVPLNPFASRLCSNTTAGMVSALKGVDTVQRIQLWLRRGKD